MRTTLGCPLPACLRMASPTQSCQATAACPLGAARCLALGRQVPSRPARLLVHPRQILAPASAAERQLASLPKPQHPMLKIPIKTQTRR